MGINTSSEYREYDYEKIIDDIVFNAPESIKISSRQGIYTHGDTGYKLTLTNGNTIILRIWLGHMYEGSGNIGLSREGKIFISACVIADGNKEHLPLYGWYDYDDFTGIWGKIIQI